MALIGVRRVLLGSTRSAPVVNPITILGSKAAGWWTADRADLITLSGAAVTSWKDVVGGYDLTQGTGAAQPIYGATSFNGAPSVTFDGTDDMLSTSSIPGTFPSSNAAGEIWGIVQQDALSSDGGTVRRIAVYGGTADSNTSRYINRQVQSAVNVAAASLGTGAAVTAKTSSTGSPMSSRHVVRGIFSTTGVALDLDGVSAGAESAAVGATASSGAVRIGASAPGNTGFWNGKIRDVLIVAGSLTNDEVTALYAWALPRRML